MAWIKDLKCVKCGYAWWPKKPTLPKVCPRCKNIHWKGGKP
jgi:predicted Zn-ribbon and HTH transcriptional regulator